MKDCIIKDNIKQLHIKLFFNKKDKIINIIEINVEKYLKNFLLFGLIIGLFLVSAGELL